MKHIEQSETFLAKWLENNISDNELNLFKSTKNYKFFSKIIEISDCFTRDHLDKEEVYNSIITELEEKENSQKEVKKMYPKWIISAAASILLFLGIFYTLNGNTEKTAGFGEQLAITLPDNSEVLLNAKTTIIYNKNSWNKKRLVNLEGEAFFKVAKGSTFTIKTNEGSVSVLGTQFNVLQEKNYLEVTCYEGKVQVESHENIVYLTAGKSFRYYKGKVNSEDQDTTRVKPNWTEGESVFKSVPLHIVLKHLEKQYNIQIESNKSNDTRLFSGSFVHNNLEQALNSILLPMNIEFTFSKTKRKLEILE